MLKLCIIASKQAISLYVSMSITLVVLMCLVTNDITSTHATQLLTNKCYTTFIQHTAIQDRPFLGHTA